MTGVTAEAKLDLIEYSPANGQFDKKLEAELEIVFNNSQTVFAPRTILESLALHGAEPVATFRGGRMAGGPAITKNRWKQGWVFYVGTDCAENAFYEALAREAAAAAQLKPLIAAPYGVEVTSREDAATTYYFLLNLTETPHSGIRLPEAMDDLITGQAGVTEVSLGPLEVAVLRPSQVSR